MRQRHARQCSALTNGSALFLGDVDGRSPIARRYADILRELEAERGGPAALSVTAREAARAYAGLAVRLEQLHTDIASGKAVDPEALGQLGDRMDRQARRMGPPKAPDKPTDLRSHIAARRAAKGA